MGSQQNQVRSHLGGLAHFSYEHILLQEFLKEGEISTRRASPPNRASSPPYEQPLKTCTAANCKNEYKEKNRFEENIYLKHKNHSKKLNLYAVFLSTNLHLYFIIHLRIPPYGPIWGPHSRVPPKCPGSWVPFSQYAVFVGLHKGNCLNELGEILFSGQW